MNRRYSVIIPFHGRREILEKVLYSLENTNYLQKEIILVNDGSGCELEPLVEKFQCRLINVPQRRGPSFARNMGAKVTDLEYLIFLDSDVVIPKDCFNKINDFLNGNKSASVINCLVSSHTPYNNFFSQYANMLYRYTILMGGRDTIFTSFCAIKAECFNRVEGFDERVLFPFADDVILGWKLHNLGCEFALVEGVEVQHYKSMAFSKFILHRFSHGYYWGRYFIIYRGILKSPKGFYKKEGPLTIAAIFLFLILVCFNIFSLTAKVFIFLGLFMGINFNFLKFLLRDKGILFTFKSIGITVFQYFVYFTGASVGIVNGFCRR